MASNATGNAEVQVSTLVAQQMRDPSITLLPAGGWIAVWGADSEDDVEFAHTVFQRFDAAGNPVGAETQVGDPEVFYIDATVLPLSDGGWLVIHDGGDIVQQRFDAAGNAVGGETQINTVSGDLRGTTATALEDGGWVVGWNGISFNEQVFQQVFDAEGNAVGGEVRVNTTTSGRNFISDIEALPDGGWVVVWNTGDRNVEQQRFDANGDPVGGETRVNTIGGGPNSSPTVTGLIDGGWVVTWADPDGEETGIFQQRYDSDGDAVGSQTGVNTTTAGFQTKPGVTALPDGGWVVVWHSGASQDGNGSGVYMQRFDANGDAVGTETLVNVTTAGDQREASVTALDGVGWVVTWTSEDPVTFDEVVMQRVFAADIEGTNGNDTLTGTVFDEAIFGLDGDDIIFGGPGDDTLDGGVGEDTLSYAGSAQGVTVRLGVGTASGGDAEGDTFQNFENLTGSAHNDTLEGTRGTNVLKGGAGDDILVGRGGADTLEGGDGNDTFEILPTDNISGAIFDGGAGEDRLLLQTAGEGAHVYDLTGVTLTSIEEIEFFADGSGFTQHTKTASLLASQIGGGGGLSETLLIDGNDSSNSKDLVAISMGEATSLDLSGWTFQDWGTVANNGDGEFIFITGDGDAETIIGSSERDTISGGGGDDVLTGGGGDDIIDGGDGIDTASYADASGAVTVGLEAGTASGAAGNDTLSSIENVIGSDHDDVISDQDNAVDNIIHGGAGDDRLIKNSFASASDSDAWIGGAGTDTFVFVGTQIADHVVDLSLGMLTFEGELRDTLTGIENVEVLGGAGILGDDQDNILTAIGDFDNVISGGAGNDIITGGGGNDTLSGGDGDDRFIWNDGDGSDTINGGAGSDTAEVNLSDGATGDAVTLSDSSNLTLERTNLGQFTLSAASVNSFEINGHGGDDIIDASNARIFVTLDGGDGNDILSGAIFNSIIRGGAGADQMFGGGGTANLLDYSTSSAGVEVDLGTGFAAGGDSEGDSFDNKFFGIIGSDHDDVLRGRANNVKEDLFGGAGNDILAGGDGEDKLFGGDGDDLLIDGGRGDLLDGGDGIDTMSVEGRTIGMTIDLAAGTGTNGTTIVDVENVIGTTKADTIIGDEGVNVLEGRDGDDSLDGGAGADRLIGGIGDDTYVVDNAGDVVVENAGEGTDTVLSSVSYALFQQGQHIEHLTLTGTANINGTGNTLANTITGNEGDNLLNGGGGADRLIGGVGDDTYVVDNAGDVIVEVADEGTDTVLSSVSYALFQQGQHIENLTLSGTANLSATGNTLANILTGNAGNNLLTGGAGDDTLDGGAGVDRLVGGAGNDTYVVDNVGDVVVEIVNEGIDTVQSSISYALFQQGQHIEQLTLTGTANLNGTGNALDNTLTGNGGNNVLNGGAGADIMRGGAGNDTYVVDNEADVIVEIAHEGIDTVLSSVSYALFQQGQHIENLTLTGTDNLSATGNTLANILTGNAGNNLLNGGAGDDTLDGGAGADRLIGGAGNDTYVVDNFRDVIVEAADEGIDTVLSSVSYALFQQGQHIENLTLTGTDNSNAVGNTLDNNLTGNSGVNTLTGGAGNDTLDGGAGADTMIGGVGDDTYVVDNSGDTVIEAADEGTDTVISSVSYALFQQGQHIENLTLAGSANINAAGNALANILTGNTGNNLLDGGAGDDTLDGGAGADSMTGGAGNDTYVVDNGGDVVVESANEGIDTVQSSVSYALFQQGQHIENLTLAGTANLNGTGNTLANTITGNAGNNVLNGGAGADRLIGGAGNDTYHVDNAGDVIVENANEGTDTVISSVSYALYLQSQHIENLTLTGASNINAVGNALDNIITGNSGNNLLNGGAGADTFRFFNNSDNDTIQAFQNGLDRFDFASHTLVNSMADLAISTVGSDALVTFAGGQFTALGAAGLIEASDFVFA
ncbi:hypothetical protein [Hoeflea sp.]|uniref:beta strand repeat-containing protein n=1 Tax=Hoeflea sp. TaxID=1940281 RepID=UPI0019BE8BBB|nr:hypothetical protein [Hoeflea sp.]MBC7281297.1 hypothetical protein [Hoeflea sp.]